MEKRETSSRQTTDKREGRVGCGRLIASLLTRRATTEATTTSANMANPVRVVDRDSSKRLWEAGSGSCRGWGREWRGAGGALPTTPCAAWRRLHTHSRSIIIAMEYSC